jgi:nitrite reductase (NADH) large subunit
MGKSRTSSVNAMSETGKSPKQLVVVGGGMVARRLVDALRERDGEGRWAVTLLAEEPRAPYDRVALTSYFTGRDPDDLALGSQEIWHDRLVSLKRGVKVTAVDREKRTVTTADGSRLPYDALVLATGSYAAVPPVKGNDLRGTFVYRTIDDVADLRSFVESRRDELGRPVRGAVIGGGLLGLEAAGALVGLGAGCTVVEFAPRLMALQVDEGGGHALRRTIEAMGVDVRVGTASESIDADADGRVAGLRLAGADEAVPVDVVVFATGVRPRDELARPAGLPTGERGGVVVDEGCRTAGPAGLGHRRGRLHRGTLPGPGRTRLHDGRDRCRPAARRRRHVPRGRPVHQAQAARGRRRILR